MSKTMTIKQVWQCPKCKLRYESSVRVKEVLCPRPHARGSRQMELIEGELPQERERKK